MEEERQKMMYGMDGVGQKREDKTEEEGGWEELGKNSGREMEL